MNLLNEPWREIERREKRLASLRKWLALAYLLAGFLAGLAVGRLIL